MNMVYREREGEESYVESYSGARQRDQVEMSKKLIADGYAIAHVNAGGVISKESARVCEKLIKGGYASFLASDTHSVHNRPPQIKQALDIITDKLGKSAANRLIIKSNNLLEEIEAANV